MRLSVECLASIAKALSIEIETEFPSLQFGLPGNMLEDNLLEHDDMILDVTIDMHLVESDISVSPPIATKFIFPKAFWIQSVVHLQSK